MARKVFDLRGVPTEELEAVRSVLENGGVEFYETPPGAWGISGGAIWVNHDADHTRARELIDVYQRELVASQKAEPRTSILESFRRNPIQFIAYLGVALLILYLSTRPFINFGQ